MFGEHGRARVRAARGFTSLDRAGPPIYLYHPGGMLGLCFHLAPELMLSRHECWVAQATLGNAGWPLYMESKDEAP